MKKPFTCSYCEEGIFYISPSTNKNYCEKHFETEFMCIPARQNYNNVKKEKN